jgi:hypothetical protein
VNSEVKKSVQLAHLTRQFTQVNKITALPHPANSLALASALRPHFQGVHANRCRLTKMPQMSRFLAFSSKILPAVAQTDALRYGPAKSWTAEHFVGNRKVRLSACRAREG